MEASFHPSSRYAILSFPIVFDAQLGPKDLKYKDLGEEMSSGNSIFKPCKQYLDIINGAAGSNDRELPSTCDVVQHLTRL
jgi:hypothetical protein